MYTQEILGLELILYCVLLDFLIFVIYGMTKDRKEQQGIYEELYGEYRKLKRMNMQLEHNARLEERTKIARDIHDSVGHRLTALIMKLEMLSIKQKNEAYEELKKMAKDSLEETRQAVKALQSEENEGISTVVHLIRRLEAESHMLVQLTIKQGVLSIPLSNQKNVALYRAIQESLTNAMRHGDSREVHVILSKSATGDLSFEIKNMIHLSKSIVYGFGIRNMKQRVEDVNGILHVYQNEKEFIVLGTIPNEGE
ncbi:sensor histidine kinase [Oceanobacillus halophilus]|uniref:sensor histidine kinase n=1 Tax=Oceanobacillus halophilus TaxID=930130 RepID=UPI001F4D979A|nr:histidine kinase [Oceanobacillus halophilus]